MVLYVWIILVIVLCSPLSCYCSIMEIPYIYYNPTTKIRNSLSSMENVLMNESLEETDIGTLKFNSPEVNSTKKFPVLQRIGFRSNGCTCQDLSCNCCLGINMEQFQVNREGCIKFTYDPQNFLIAMDVNMDGNSVFSNEISAQNPPPLCIPIPIPYVPIQVETCAKLFDIHTPGQSLHMCFDFETRIERAPVLVLHFECMQIGSNGVNFVKPGHVDTPSSTALPGQDIYDVVTEVKVRKFKP